MSLKARLGLGAALLCLTTVVVALVSILATERISGRLEAALSAEKRVERYGALSTQVSSFIVIAAEAIQSGLPAETRTERFDTLAGSVFATFEGLRSDLSAAVSEAAALGLDEQSRRATQSLGLARMEALFAQTATRLANEGDPTALRGALDSFAAAFDPLLNTVITEEIRARTRLLAGIDALRRQVVVTSVALSLLAVLAASVFYLALVRPQFARLGLVQGAARRIGAEEFDIALPARANDEIGALMAETNRMAGMLAARQAEVRAEWERLNETVEARTAELRDANARLARTDEDRRRFFADISHELRTPLTVIAMEAQLGRAEGGAAGEAFGIIETRAARLSRRIDDLLRVARSETGRLALESMRFDLSEAARASAEETAKEREAAGMTLEMETPEGMWVTGDPNWTRQVLTTLVRNAIRHAGSGGRLRIETYAGAYPEAAVIDAGPGLPEGSELFDRFAQGGGDRRREGFGIGLALAKWVVEAQGGRIAATSPLPREEAIGAGPGTKVAIALPRADP